MSMEENLIIEAWDDGDGRSTIEDFIASLPVETQNRIIKKNEHFQQYTISRFKNGKHLEKIRGEKFELWELKYPFHSPPYRAVCIIRNSKIILLEMFSGSGSHGNVLKYVPRAVQRAQEWDQKNPISHL